jgi:HSP20 family protein
VDGSAFTPAVDIDESADDFTVRVDLPGVSQKDVKVSLMGDTLTIRGERKARRDSEGPQRSSDRAHLRGVRADLHFWHSGEERRHSHARYRDGVLEVVVPKAEEAKVREIEIQAAS